MQGHAAAHRVEKNAGGVSNADRILRPPPHPGRRHCGESAKRRCLQAGRHGARRELLALCGLPEDFARRYPHEVSGGQCQRAAIARALAIEPKLLICDEATSALDVTIQAEIIDLLRSLRKELGMSILFVCHDIALVQQFCDRVLVMYRGELVEQGVPSAVITAPKNAYTQELIRSIL